MTKLTDKKRAAFLKTLAGGGSITKGCELIGISRQAMYARRSADEDFAREWDDAVEAGTDCLEDEAFRRAFEGTEKPVGFYKGQASAHVKEYSDTLMIFLLKGRRPDKYRESVQHEHSGGVSITVSTGINASPGSRD